MTMVIICCVTGPWCRRRSFTADIWSNQVEPRRRLRRADGCEHCFRSC